MSLFSKVLGSSERGLGTGLLGGALPRKGPAREVAIFSDELRRARAVDLGKEPLAEIQRHRLRLLLEAASQTRMYGKHSTLR